MPTKHHPKHHPRHHPKASHQGVIPAWAKSPTPVPPALLHAIYVAAKKFNVPPDVLAGIWRGESGSTFPNPAVNSLGYGGLFGTKLWNGTTQAQADYAASILHNALRSTHGDINGAINIYQTGSTGHRSYNPPGMISTGVVAGYGGKKSGHQSSIGSRLVGLFTFGLAGSSPSSAPGPTNPFAKGGPLNFLDPFHGWTGKIIDAATILGGGFVFILGFILIAADIGLSNRATRTLAEIPAARYVAKGVRAKTSRATGSTSKTTASPRKEERAEEMHQARIRESEARTKKHQAQATESRTRQKNRRRTRKEQEESEKKAYYRGATDAASPTMTKIRRSRKS